MKIAPHISNTVSKLGNIPTVNLPAVVTCRPGAPCTKGCYACKGNFIFANVQKSLQANLYCWQTSPDVYRSTVELAAMQNRFFRWHSSGDIPDESYLRMMFDVAETVPTCKFLAFTKRVEWVNSLLDVRTKPKNLSIVLSAWGNWIPDNPHNLPIAYVHLRSGEGASFIPADAKSCSGACYKCVSGDQNCWALKSGESVVFNQH